MDRPAFTPPSAARSPSADLTPVEVSPYSHAVHVSRLLPTQRQQAAVAGRCGYRACIALLIVVALGAGALGVGHHHLGEELLDEHQCALCHAPSISIEPALADTAVLAVVPQRRAWVRESAPTGRLASRVSPPLRGPPAC